MRRLLDKQIPCGCQTARCDWTKTFLSHRVQFVYPEVTFWEFMDCLPISSTAKHNPETTVGRRWACGLVFSYTYVCTGPSRFPTHCNLPDLLLTSVLREHTGRVWKRTSILLSLSCFPPINTFVSYTTRIGENKHLVRDITRDVLTYITEHNAQSVFFFPQKKKRAVS